MLWRMVYSLPPNDPRVLEITEDEILDDLLARNFYRRGNETELQRLTRHLREHTEDLDHLIAAGKAIATAPKPPAPTPPRLARRHRAVKP